MLTKLYQSRGSTIPEYALLLAILMLPAVVVTASMSEGVGNSYRIAGIASGGGSSTTMLGDSETHTGDDPVTTSPTGPQGHNARSKY